MKFVLIKAVFIPSGSIIELGIHDTPKKYESRHGSRYNPNLAFRVG